MPKTVQDQQDPEHLHQKFDGDVENRTADIEERYKYLGIPHANGNNQKATRKAGTTKYLQKIRQVLKRAE